MTQIREMTPSASTPATALTAPWKSSAQYGCGGGGSRGAAIIVEALWSQAEPLVARTGHQVICLLHASPIP